MKIEFSPQEKDKIYKGIRKKYKKVAKKPKGLFKYPTGNEGLEALQYDSEIIKALPETVIASYCAVGNPFTLGAVKEGESILDIGWGSFGRILPSIFSGLILRWSREIRVETVCLSRLLLRVVIPSNFFED